MTHDITRMIEESPANARLLRLFACACVRRHWSLLNLEGCRTAVKVAEGYADGRVSSDDLNSAWWRARGEYAADARNAAASSSRLEGRYNIDPGIVLSHKMHWASVAAGWAAHDKARDAAKNAALSIRTTVSVGCFSTEWLAQAKLATDILGDGRDVCVTENSVALAAQLYDEGDDPFLRDLLADTQEEGGCQETADRLRDAPAFKGSWVLDKILGRRR